MIDIPRYTPAAYQGGGSNRTKRRLPASQTNPDDKQSELANRRNSDRRRGAKGNRLMDRRIGADRRRRVNLSV
jgi:hypothetical protein